MAINLAPAGLTRSMASTEKVSSEGEDVPCAKVQLILTLPSASVLPALARPVTAGLKVHVAMYALLGLNLTSTPSRVALPCE